MALLQNVIMRGTHAARPAAGSQGLLYFESDTGQLFRDSGSAWQLIDLTALFATKGDLLVGTGSGTVAKLAAGTDAYVLTADSAQTDGIKWAAAAGSSGAMTQISDQTVSGSVAASIAFSSFGGYNHLKLLIQARGDTAANNVRVKAQMNADSTSGHYIWNYSEFFAGNSSNGAQNAGTTSADLGSICGNTSAPSTGPGQIEVLIANYAGTTWQKTTTSLYGFTSGGGASGILNGNGFSLWESTAAITSLSVFPSAGNFAIGSRFTLYGYL